MSINKWMDKKKYGIYMQRSYYAAFKKGGEKKKGGDPVTC